MRERKPKVRESEHNIGGDVVDESPAIAAAAAWEWEATLRRDLFCGLQKQDCGAFLSQDLPSLYYNYVKCCFECQ